MSKKSQFERGVKVSDKAVSKSGIGEPSVAVVDKIRNHILSLKLAPGTRIDDKLLMDEFGVGRTPAREAFNRLAAEGLIIIQRNKGAYVRPLDIQQIREFFDAYSASERLVGFFCQMNDESLLPDLRAIECQYEAVAKKSLYLEMTKLNSEFHLRIAQATRNEYISDFAQRLYNHARRLSYFIYLMPYEPDEALQKMNDSIVGQHEDVLSAIRRKDNSELVRALSLHAEYFHHWVIRAISMVAGFNAPLPDRKILNRSG